MARRKTPKLPRIMQPTNPWGQNLRRMPLPRNDEELRVLTAIYFGTPLRLRELMFGRYEVENDYDSYHGKNWISSESQYAADGRFWDRVVGRLSCGGVARASYGSVHIDGYRNQKRLAHWENSRRTKRGSSLRSPFVRLAQRYGLGEIIAIRGSGEQTGNRVDGVSAACSSRSPP